MKKILYFINYDPIEDCYYLRKSRSYSINEWNYYELNGNLYSKKNKMVFDTEEEAKKELKRINKILKYMEV